MLRKKLLAIMISLAFVAAFAPAAFAAESSVDIAAPSAPTLMLGGDDAHGAHDAIEGEIAHTHAEAAIAQEALGEEAVEATEANASSNTRLQWVKWQRLAGNTAYDTMASIVKKGWAKSDTVIVTTFDGYWDALSASALAGKNKAPILFTSPNDLHGTTASEIKRLGATKAVIVGGPSVVSDKVVSALKKRGLSVTRIFGSTAQETAVAVAEQFKGSATCVVATSGGYWDALSASPYAYWAQAPIYLTDDKGNLTAATLKAIKAGGHKTAVIAGGPKAVTANTEQSLKAAGLATKRCGGINAYETSSLLAAWEVSQGMKYANMGIATAIGGYWDALAGGAFCGSRQSVLMLADDDAAASAAAKAKFARTMMGSAFILGGTAAVGNKAQRALSDATATVVRSSSSQSTNVVNQPTTPAPSTPSASSTTTTPTSDGTYVGNKNSLKFHHPWCDSVAKMRNYNKVYFSGGRSEPISRGYAPCLRCNP